MPYRVAVLTVSDTASKDSAADKSGPLIKDIIVNKGFECIAQEIVPDEENLIKRTVLGWSTREDIDWIITTGGTGFGVRDRTPEAIKPLIEREAAGLVHLLLSTSLQYTPLAALSRPVAGTVGDTLVVTLPGSQKAVRENLDALLNAGVIEHALDLIQGGSGKKVHTALSSETHHHHHHHHHHDHHAPTPRTILSHDMSLSVSARHRISPYPMVTHDEAMAIVLRETNVTETITQLVTSNLKGHVLAEDVYAPSDVPSSQTTNVDGYALRSTDPPGTYKVVTPQTHPLLSPLPPGCIYRINTGAPLPAGADSVIMVEDTQLVSTYDSSNKDAEEKEVQTLTQVPVGDNVRKPGSDVTQGELVLQNAEILQGSGGEIGTLAFVGRKEVVVHRKPIVALLSTGNELVDIQTKTNSHEEDGGWSGIWDVNRPSLQGAIESMGYEVLDIGIVNDELSAHVKAIRAGIDNADIIVTTGGTSMGASDLLKPVIEHQLNGTIHFGRVNVKPGKPTTFATVPCSTTGAEVQKPLFALPGNPASALVMFYVFVVPALRKMAGWPTSRCQLPRVRIQLTEPMRLDARLEFHRVIIRGGSKGLKAFSTGGQRSSRVASLSGANGLVALPMKQSGGPTELKAGEFADAILIGEIQAEGS